jgi:hypothetical protein
VTPKLTYPTLARLPTWFALLPRSETANQVEILVLPITEINLPREPERG